ncbi:MAG: hypothetical protein GKR89_27030 [Candidatus Latescibacteria bacterium]|nr:hypothetical protein [Candidatus Latescibacterota bacterium]
MSDSWHTAQAWQRDNPGPCLGLGEAGAFDDTHIFAPCVALQEDVFSMWYCGSKGAVADRVFALGLATSTDGVHFQKSPTAPVFTFGDDTTSVLTPTLLRNPDGSLLRENGRLRMWFAATDFPRGDGRHTLHESTSLHGLDWYPPSPPQLEAIYAPTIIKEGDQYRMWYTAVGTEPWSICHAHSADGKNWTVAPEPVLQLDQTWEAGRLFYPTVLKDGDLYLMWYGSYWGDARTRTALGLATSTDGLSWRKNPHNPVLKPDPERTWESHYTTSQSVMRLPDGRWRVWYGARTKPPFVHKYFAIGTAVWTRSDCRKP